MADFEALLFFGKRNLPAARRVLHAAIKKNQYETEVRLRELGIADDVLDATTTAISDPAYGRFGLLHLASLVGEIDYVLLLLTVWNLDPNVQIGGCTPLMLSVLGRSLEVAEALCNGGALLEQNSNVGALELAISDDNVQMVECLLRNLYCDKKSKRARAQVPLMVIAAQKGLANAIKFLLNHGKDPNVTDENGRRPVEIAAALKNRDCVDILIGPTTDLNIENVKRMMNDLVITAQGQIVEGTLIEETQVVEAKLRKGVVNIFFAIMDKVPTSLLAVCGFGFAYLTGSERKDYVDKWWFQIFCATCMISFCSSIILFGCTAYYKELECIDGFGFRVCSCSVLGILICLVGLLAFVLINFEGAITSTVAIAGVMSIIIVLLSWPMLGTESKSVALYLIELAKRKWDCRRHRTPLDPATLV